VGGGGGSIGGSGTINYVPKFTASGFIGNSSIVDSSSTVAMTINPSGKVGINTLTPVATLDVNGSFRILGIGSNVNPASAGTSPNYFRFLSSGADLYIGTEGNTAGGFFTGSLAYDNVIYGNSTAINIINGGVSRLYVNSTGNIGIGYTAPAAKLSVSGTTLINTNTDNGVDKLQVSGSGYYNGSGVLGKFDGTSTNNAYIDFRTSGTAKWQLGNNAGSSNDFNLLNSATGVNSMVVNSSNQIGFNMEGAFLGSNSAFEYRKKGSQFITRYFSYDAAGLGVSIDTRSTRTNTYGAFSATLSGDPIFQFYTNGSDNSAHRIAGFFGHYQEGSTTTTAVPGYWTIESNSGSQQGRTKIKIDGNNDYIGFYTSSNGINSFGNERMRVAASGRLLLNTTTDNTVDELQVNGSISGIGFKQAYVTKTGAYTATNDDYVIDCTSGTFTVTLPASSGRTGRILIIKNSGAGTITVDGNASETIDGAATYSLAVQYATVQIMSDGTNWKIIAKF
jgi:hypothetical protein